MANETQFQVAVISCLSNDTEEPMLTEIHSFSPDQFKQSMSTMFTELAHGPKLLDETTRKLVLEIEFTTDTDLCRRVADVHAALASRCFNFPFKQPQVVSCEIRPPKGFGDRASVVCLFNNGESKTVIEYFDDELSFTESEFIGLTQEECTALHVKKDTAYLRS